MHPQQPWKPFREKTGKFTTQTESFHFAHSQTVQKIIPKKVPNFFLDRLARLKASEHKK